MGDSSGEKEKESGRARVRRSGALAGMCVCVSLGISLSFSRSVHHRITFQYSTRGDAFACSPFVTLLSHP